MSCPPSLMEEAVKVAFQLPPEGKGGGAAGRGECGMEEEFDRMDDFGFTNKTGKNKRNLKFGDIIDSSSLGFITVSGMLLAEPAFCYNEIQFPLPPTTNGNSSPPGVFPASPFSPFPSKLGRGVGPNPPPPRPRQLRTVM